MSVKHQGFNFVSQTLMFPDWKHLIKKWRNQILIVRQILVVGKGFIMVEDFMRLYESSKFKSSLWKSDVHVRSQQNVDAAIRILKPQVRQCLQEWNKDQPEALCVYLKAGHDC